MEEEKIQRNMRLKHSFRNVKVAWIVQFTHILCQFSSRTAIIYFLSIEYVGLSGLFSNILTMLSLAELGIGQAITFSLYDPIAKEDVTKIKSIMRFYKRVYIAIGICISTAGIMISQFLELLIKETPDNIDHLQLIFVLYVLNTSLSYFFSYKATYVTATQHNSIVMLNEGITEFLMVASQILVLYLTRDFILYLVIGIVFILVRNISITYIANRRHPYLREKSVKALDKAEYKSIIKNTGAMVLHRIGAAVVFATDNIILSKLIGLTSVGIYTNYCLITNSVTTFIGKVFSSIAASVGNLVAVESTEIQLDRFHKLTFMNFWIQVFCCCCLMNLLNPFIGTVWLKEEYVLSNWIVLAIVISFYISGMRSSVQAFKNAKGLYWQNKYMPIAESLVNLVASIILVRLFGVIGVILGTIISSVLTCVWIEPRVLYKFGFDRNPTEYYVEYIKKFLLFLTILGSSYLCNRMITGDSLGIFCARMLSSIAVPNIIMIMIYRKTDEYKYLTNAVKILSRK